MEASALSAPAGLRRDGDPAARTSPWLRLRSDEQLVGLFRSGSEEAFRAIHDRYRQRLYGYARQMLASSADAEDVMQDVFLRAYRSLRADERPVSLRAWLYRVAHNRCIDALRRPAPAPSDVFEMSRPPGHDPLAAAERREDLQRLVADVRRLPDQQRSALLMREMDGMSYAELAAALETTVPAVKSLLVRARIGLVEAVDARDADCADIRHDLAASYDRGVRSSGRARRHLRDCPGCTTYRAQLRTVRHGFAALSPASAAPGLLAKLLGIGGATTGGAAAAGGAASGTGLAVGGGAAAVGVTKVAAVVCCAAAITGGAAEVEKLVAPVAERATATAGTTAGAATADAAGPTTGAAPAVVAAAATAAPAGSRGATTAAEPRLRGASAVAPPARARDRDRRNGAGGHAAPADKPAEEGAFGTPRPAPAVAGGEHPLPLGNNVIPLGAEAGSGAGSTSGSSQTDAGNGTGAGTSSGSGSSGPAASSGSGSGSSTQGGSASTSSGSTASSSGSSTSQTGTSSSGTGSSS